MNVLVVDDEADTESLFRQRFRKELKAGTLSLEFAPSAESALEFLERGTADLVLVLSDINLPGMCGIELLRQIKERYAHTAVYMIAPFNDEARSAEVERAGAAALLTKPLDFDELKRMMSALCP
ncbi:MAG: response regulator [Candidatus Hydrogenedentes bacterium]|nr:response regulator [Candidatus Hydrogenedentota bacterium]